MENRFTEFYPYGVQYYRAPTPLPEEWEKDLAEIARDRRNSHRFQRIQNCNAGVGVSLCRSQRRVPQQRLYLTNIGTTVEQVCCERVSQNVWALAPAHAVSP